MVFNSLFKNSKNQILIRCTIKGKKGVCVLNKITLYIDEIRFFTCVNDIIVLLKQIYNNYNIIIRIDNTINVYIIVYASIHIKYIISIYYYLVKNQFNLLLYTQCSLFVRQQSFNDDDDDVREKSLIISIK